LEVQIAAVLQQSQPVIAVAERPLSRREEMALKAMSLEEVCAVYVCSKLNGDTTSAFNFVFFPPDGVTVES